MSSLDCTVDVLNRCCFYFTDDALIVWVVRLGLLARSGIAELTVNEQLGSEANIHFIDMHPDWLKVQFFGTTSAAGSFDHSLL